MGQSIESLLASFKTVGRATRDHENSFLYSQVQKGLNRGENPIRLWRNFKNINSEEMAAMLEMDDATYKHLESERAFDIDEMRGICWYMDIHPVDLFGQNDYPADDCLVDALIDSYNTPSEWPNYNEDVVEIAASILSKLSDPKKSYSYFGIISSVKQKYQDKEDKELLLAMQIVTANDGNPFFHPSGITDYFKDKSDYYAEILFQKELEQRAFNRNRKANIKNMNDLGRKVYRDKWPRIKKMMDNFYSPEEPDEVDSFIQNEAKPKRGLSPITQKNKDDLAKAYSAFKKMDSLHHNMPEMNHEIETLKAQSEVFKKLLLDQEGVLKAYDNRHRILSRTKDIGKPLGNPSHSEYAKQVFPSFDWRRPQNFL